MATTHCPDGVLVIDDYLDRKTIEDLKYFSDGEIGIINKEDFKLADGSMEIRKSEGLVSERIYTRKIQESALSICDGVFGKVIPQHYDTRIEWYEYPHIIRYRKGGHYDPHADADARKDEQSSWYRNVERDFSAIIYFNDNFTGGTLFFPDYNYRLTPKPGMLVCFPSNHHYIHTAEPVISGVRYAFVTWGAAYATERLFEKPRGDIVYLDRNKT